MTAEELPLLSGALPAMERFVARWERMQEKYSSLAPAIEEGLKKVSEYYDKSYSNPAYAIAMGK